MNNEQWHLDKKVPLALILAIVVQTAGGAWFASSLNERVNQIEARQVERGSQESRLVRLEADVGYVKDSLAEVSADTRAMRMALERIANGRPTAQ